MSLDFFSFIQTRTLNRCNEQTQVFQVCVVKAISEHRQVINLRELEDVSEVGEYRHMYLTFYLNS